MNFSQLGFGVFAIKIYGVLLTFFFCLAAWHFYLYLKKNGFPITFFVRHFWRWFLMALVVGRLFALIRDPAIFQDDGIFSFFAVWEGEIDFFGALAGGLSLMAWDLRRNQMKFWRWLDAAMASFFIFILGTDLSGFFTGRVYGIETKLPWGVQYETFGVDILAPVHPVTLYAFVFHLILLRWIVGNIDKFSKNPGHLAKIAAMIFFATDFFLQFLRGDATIVVWEFFRIEQIVDFALVVACVIGLQRKKA
ncbi:hypothetical protein HOA64_02095 [bacterium]|jgi:prolipoprotein diacylglyceryltransferase|nr:hypothetical protein [bacterium]MBT7772488.1 hypothetical protein [bacterium]